MVINDNYSLDVPYIFKMADKLQISNSLLLWRLVHILSSWWKIRHRISSSIVFLPIMKLSNESNEEIQANEYGHECPWVTCTQYINWKSHIQVIMKFQKSHLFNSFWTNSLAITQWKMSPSSVESIEIISDKFLSTLRI